MPVPILIGSAACAAAPRASSNAAAADNRNGLVLRVISAGAARRVGDQLVLQPIEMGNALLGLGAGPLLGFGDVDRGRDIDLAAPGMAGAFPAVLVSLDVRRELVPGRVAGAGEDRVA